MRLLRPVIAVAALAAALPAAAHAQWDDEQREQRVQRDAFAWDGTVRAGRWLYLRNVNGGIRVERGGDRVEVRAQLRANGDARFDDVRFVAQRARDGQSMVICALWYEGSSCDEEGYRGSRDRNDRRNGSVSAEFTVRLPEGVRLDLSSVNGGLQVRGASSEVVARTVNGGIRVETLGGPVSARTVNGSIDARMSSVGDARDLEFTSTNGSVTVALPGNVGADVELATVNGRVSTDFPITVSGRIDPRRLRATIGDGSRRLRIRTVNGSVELRKTD
jgi:hypothetical protein